MLSPRFENQISEIGCQGSLAGRTEIIHLIAAMDKLGRLWRKTKDLSIWTGPWWKKIGFFPLF